ncbi:MAG: serine/threonine protein kinase [Phycisphaerales bacterium]|nr:serine/threonine protein kinase [Phycisphaerales bacterium]
MADRLASTFQPWKPGDDEPLESTRDAAILPTQTLRHEPSEVSRILDHIAHSAKNTQSLREVSVAEDTTSISPDADFVVLHEIGRGGVGVVSAAEQTSLTRPIAVKQLRADRDSTSARTQLIAEAKIQARLVHPVIPPVHLIGQDSEGNPVLVMQLIRGECWSDLLARDARKLDSGSEATLLEHLETLFRIGEAIAYAHEQERIIHRDIKPGNVMVGRYGQVYLVDWGLAVELDGNGSHIPRGFTGTPAYAAPEMIQRDSVLTAQTDVYLLGSSLCEILTGSPPHLGDSIKEVFTNINDGTPVKYPNWVPSPLRTICERALAADPSERFASAEELLAALRNYVEHHQSIGMLDRVREHVARLDQMVLDREPNERIEDLGQACRVMLEALRVQLPDSEEVSRLHRKCSILMINRMIEDNNPGAARIMLESLADDPEVKVLRERVAALTARLLARPTHIATNVQLMLTEQLVDAKREIAELKAQLNQ